MTLPDERYRAVVYARKLLEDIGYYPERTPRVPKIVRDRARAALRHFPNDWDLDQAALRTPNVFQKQMEPVTRLMAQYEESKKDGQGS